VGGFLGGVFWGGVWGGGGTLRVERRMGIVRLVGMRTGVIVFNGWLKVCVFECLYCCMGKGVMRGKLFPPRFIRFAVTLTYLRLHLLYLSNQFFPLYFTYLSRSYLPITLLLYLHVCQTVLLGSLSILSRLSVRCTRPILTNHANRHASHYA
jgi:hypothetical protein